MRIACLHIPQFALQCATRVDPALRGAAVAVVGAGDPSAARTSLHGPIVHACSRAAWALGVRVGMTATAARGLSSEIQIVTAEVATEREAMRAVADALLAVTPVVDVGGRVGAGGAHLAMYCEVPTKTRGATFGERVQQKLEVLGLTGRIGIADDRFTAWVAAWDAADDEAVVSVPRGGSAAFLAPRPLSLLSISPEVQHMLEALGVRTLGEFAALPAPSVARPFEADYQALARGDSGQDLRPYAPEAPIREEIAITRDVDARASSAGSRGDEEGEGGGKRASERELDRHRPSVAVAVAQLAQRIALRLEGRGRSAARLELVVRGEVGEEIVPVKPLSTATPMLLSSPRELAESIDAALANHHPWRLRVAVTGEAIAGEDAVISTLANDAERVDALSLVLSTTGAVDLAFGLTPTGQAANAATERRYRRTRRGKQRRRDETLVQPRLFKL